MGKVNVPKVSLEKSAGRFFTFYPSCLALPLPASGLASGGFSLLFLEHQQHC